MDSGKTRDKVAAALGVSGKTSEKAKAVVEEAAKEPEKFTDIKIDMDRTGKIEPAFKEVKKRKSETRREQATSPRGEGKSAGAIASEL